MDFLKLIEDIFMGDEETTPLLPQSPIPALDDYEGAAPAQILTERTRSDTNVASSWTSVYGSSADPSLNFMDESTAPYLAEDGGPAIPPAVDDMSGRSSHPPFSASTTTTAPAANAEFSSAETTVETATATATANTEAKAKATAPRRAPHPAASIAVLRSWWMTAPNSPYPDDEDIKKLARTANLSPQQTYDWFKNERCRKWKNEPDALPRANQKPSKKLPDGATRILKEWVEEHLANPRPTKEEKDELAATCALSVEQVANWFMNFRKRNKAAILNAARQQNLLPNA